MGHPVLVLEVELQFVVGVSQEITSLEVVLVLSETLEVAGRSDVILDFFEVDYLVGAVI